MSGRDLGAREPTQKRDQLVSSEDLREDLQGNSKKSEPIDDTNDNAETRNVFWPMEGYFIYCQHVEPRVQLNIPEEKTFPIPLNNIDVTRATYTNLDVLQAKYQRLLGRRCGSNFIRFMVSIHEDHVIE